LRPGPSGRFYDRRSQANHRAPDRAPQSGQTPPPLFPLWASPLPHKKRSGQAPADPVIACHCTGLLHAMPSEVRVGGRSSERTYSTATTSSALRTSDEGRSGPRRASRSEEGRFEFTLAAPPSDERSPAPMDKPTPRALGTCSLRQARAPRHMSNAEPHPLVFWRATPSGRVKAWP
jgi:hypothetical protein